MPFNLHDLLYKVMQDSLKYVAALHIAEVDHYISCTLRVKLETEVNRSRRTFFNIWDISEIMAWFRIERN